MPTSYADRVKETTSTTGTGTYSLNGAVTGYRAFIGAVSTGSTVSYCVENGTDWEVGLGVVTDGTPDTLTRASVLASSNGGAAVNWSAGDKNVFLTAPASTTVLVDKVNTFTEQQNFNAALTSTTGTFTGVVTGPVGSVTAPSYTFATDSNTGIYRSAADTLDFAVGGVRGLQVGTVASAVNYIQILPWTAGGAPDIKALGTDTNIGMFLIPKGGGAASAVNISNDNTSYMTFNCWSGFTETYYNSSSASNTNYFITKGTTTGATHFLQAWDGSSGYFNMLGVQPFTTITGTQNYVLVTSHNAGSAPRLSAAGGDTNINLELFGKGTGSIRLNGTATTVSSTGAISTSQVLTATSGVNVTGNVAVTTGTVSAVRGFLAAEFNAGNSGTSLTLDFNNGVNQVVTMTGNCVFNFSNPQAGAIYKLRLVQGGSGSYTAAFPTIKWAGATAPTLSTVVGREDIITLYYNGTSYYGQAGIDFR